jgi:hypothetical protein
MFKRFLTFFKKLGHSKDSAVEKPAVYNKGNDVPTIPDSKKFHDSAVSLIGVSLSDNFNYGSAEAINRIAEISTGKQLGGGNSTILLDWFLNHNIDRFKKLVKGEITSPGDIIISSTLPDFTNSNIGNVGIISFNDVVIFHDPVTGKIGNGTFTVRSWIEHYTSLGLSVDIFRLL